MSTVNVKPWFDPESIRTRILPLQQTQGKVTNTWSGQEFKALYAQDVIPSIIPLNFTGMKAIRPPPVVSRMYVPPVKWDPVKEGVHLLQTPPIQRAFCPIL